jgi:hypothetical protein
VVDFRGRDCRKHVQHFKINSAGIIAAIFPFDQFFLVFVS